MGRKARVPNLALQSFPFLFLRELRECMDVFIISNDQERKNKSKFKMDFKKSVFFCCSNLSNDDITS